MSEEYGITMQGFNRKRADVILSELHADVSSSWGVDTTLYEQSFINALLKTQTAKYAELWEVAEATYFAMYPSTARGINLDNAMEFGGMSRLSNAKTIYTLKCTGVDGTGIMYGTRVRSTTQPAKDFECLSLQYISKDRCRAISIQVATVTTTTYYVDCNGITYSYTANATDTAQNILQGLYDAFTVAGIKKTLSDDKLTLTFENEISSSYDAYAMSQELMTSSVTSNILFASVDDGDIIMPDNSITEIVTSTEGFKAVTNDITRTAGRDRATDIAAYQDYIKRIAMRSKNIINGMVAKIYELEGVLSATGKENYTDEVDSDGRPPHSFEILVDGGDDSEIARIIYDMKAPGIHPFGTQYIDIADEFGNITAIGFSRPSNLYVWLKVIMTAEKGKTITANYKVLAKNAIIEHVDQYGLGSNVVLRKFDKYIDTAISGLQDIMITAAITTDKAKIPFTSEYIYNVVEVNARQKSIFSIDRIEVMLNE